jgi:hypothetical protein
MDVQMKRRACMCGEHRLSMKNKYLQGTRNIRLQMATHGVGDVSVSQITIPRNSVCA